jgi:RND family efflux transporter MFP subunit
MDIEKSQPAGAPTPPAKEPPRLLWMAAVVVIIAVIVVVALRLPHGNPRTPAETGGPVTVAVAKVERADLFKEKPLPAEFRPYAEVELHAKVSGYVDQINVDFGDKVKGGQLLATLEVPELADELSNARAVQQRAEVDYTNAHLINERMQKVNQEHPNLVAQQDLDTARAKEDTAAAAIAAAKADVSKYETLTKYTKITAPFDGVITKRYVDPGTLIQAATGSATQAMPVVRVSDNYRLRLDFYVTQEDVKSVRVGDPVKIRIDALGGKTLNGTISRFTSRVEETTRLMEVEIEVPNPKLEFVPGMYVSVMFRVEEHPHVLAVPPEAISGEKNPTVYVVNANREIESRPVTLGVETSDRFEITSGLQEGELVMIGGRSLVHPGEKVEPKLMERAANETR